MRQTDADNVKQAKDADEIPSPLTARFHAVLHQLYAMTEVLTMPPDGDVCEYATGMSPATGHTRYTLVMSDEQAEREALSVELARDLATAGTVAASITCTAVNRETGRETVFVLASDRSGAEEAWAADIVRRDGLTPALTEWERVNVGGALMFTLHAGVGNALGMMEVIALHGAPPAFAARLRQYPKSE